MADKLSAEMAQLKIASKKAPGKMGTIMQVETNVRPIALKPNLPFFKFDVRVYLVFMKKDGEEGKREVTKQTKDDFESQQRKDLATGLLEYVLKNNASFFDEKTHTVFYDRAAILFSTKKLLPNAGEERTFTIPSDVLRKPEAIIVSPENRAEFGDSIRIDVVIKAVTDGYQVSTNDVKTAMNTDPSKWDKGILEVLNIAVSKYSIDHKNEFFIFGRNTFIGDPSTVFKPEDTPNVSAGKYSAIGANKSAKIIEGVDGQAIAAVNTDITKTVFHADHQGLMEKAACELGCGKDQVIAMLDRNQNVFKQAWKNLSVQTTYNSRGDKKRTFHFGGFCGSANRSTMEKDGQRMTIDAYFKTHKGITLKFPGAPCVFEAGRPDSCYPIELLVCAPNQRVTKEQENPADKQVMVRASAALPAVRSRQSNQMATAMHLNSQNQQLKQAGITVSDRPMVIPARVLPNPTPLFAGNKPASVAGGNKWRADGKFIKPVPLKCWAIFALLDGRDNNQNNIQAIQTQFVQAFCQRCATFGMNVTRPALVKAIAPNQQALKENMAFAKKNGAELVMFISSANVKLHSFVKLDELEDQVLTQEVTLKNALVVHQKPDTLMNIIQKTNLKLGGTNYALKSDIWADMPLVVGIEFSHPPALSGAEIARGAKPSMPTVVGYCANTKAADEFTGGYYYQNPRVGTIGSGGDNKENASEDEEQSYFRQTFKMLLCDKRVSNGNKPPMHIYFYVSGVSEGAYTSVMRTTVDQIMKTCHSLSPQYNPKITIVGVSKDHHERFYRTKIEGTRAPEQNLPSGIVIDKAVVNPVVSEFFLQAHQALQGTAKVPKYSVLYDSKEWTMDKHQQLAHHLCFMHQIVNLATSTPTPLYVASESAKRGHDNYRAKYGLTTTESGSADLEKLNAEGTYAGKALGKRRFNA